MDAQHYPVYYQSYIEKVPEGNLVDLLDFSLSESLKTLVMIPESKGDHRYEEGKWSIKDILQHLIDTERIFCFRALAFSRGEQNEIAGYDHDLYVQNANADQRSMKSLLEELRRLRASTIDLFKSLNDEQLKLKGKANGQVLSVEQIGHVIIGHEMHHVAIIEERYN
ncbi:MAG: damage-inducible protein DinB [Flavobacteriales bacterium]|nr:damage-inducible protein DinB [Flavobacteriales bacterium]